MPTETFENLDKDRKQRFIEAAFDEFISHDYDGASISRMVKKLGFGKGSVYRYFKDKKDLYFYLKELAEQKKMERIMPILTDQSQDFFDMYRGLFLEGIRFMKEEPRHSQFLYNLSQERQLDEIGDILVENKKMAREAFAQQITAYQEQRILRGDLPAELLAAMVVEASSIVSNYFLEKYDEEYKESLQKPGKTFPIREEEMHEVVDGVLNMLRDGIGHKNE
ncbi:MAG: TetR/AcrR family transcriptional regulator [Bacteroidota bacterium]